MKANKVTEYCNEFKKKNAKVTSDKYGSDYGCSDGNSIKASPGN